jgi:hypothetical protein
MFRKLVLAFAAVATIGTAALTPSTASAFTLIPSAGGGHHHHHHWGYRGFALGYALAPAYAYSCIKLVRTPYGWREVNVCY